MRDVAPRQHSSKEAKQYDLQNPETEANVAEPSGCSSNRVWEVNKALLQNTSAWIYC